jgi:hypothetical protein
MQLSEVASWQAMRHAAFGRSPQLYAHLAAIEHHSYSVISHNDLSIAVNEATLILCFSSTHRTWRDFSLWHHSHLLCAPSSSVGVLPSIRFSKREHSVLLLQGRNAIQRYWSPFHVRTYVQWQPPAQASKFPQVKETSSFNRILQYQSF